MSKDNFCPNSDSGNHRYFVFKVVEVFEHAGSLAIDGTMRDVYQKVEYAVMGCNCGSSIKSPVVQNA